MASDPTIATIRFGYGLGPKVAARPAPDHLGGLGGPDRMARAYPGTSLSAGLKMVQDYRASRKAIRDKKSGAQDAYDAARRALRNSFRDTLKHALARIADTDTPFRERLAWFWADHFTAVAKQAPFRGLTSAYIDEAIRPHIAGKFEDMVRAVVTHPFMLAYLDQTASVGPQSPLGKRRGMGLNENLAREVLELHTLGVGGGYSQADVTHLAELMTGLSVDMKKGFVFRPAMAQPGAETVLGKRYGGGRARLEHVLSAMDDIANHPDTARHIATKLAIHFVADNPDPDLITDLEKAFLTTGGDLMTVYGVLLNHPTAHSPLGAKAKQPFDFVSSSLVAMGFSGRDIVKMSTKDMTQAFYQPMEAMGQPFLAPGGPDGWPEAAEDWITPQGLATRISWSVAVAREVQARIDDPREFLDLALADAASGTLKFAVGAAETKVEGITLVLASPEFNRR